MAKKLKKLLAIILAASITMSILNVAALATGGEGESPDPPGAVDPYVYQYQKLPNPDPEGKPLPDAVVRSEFLYDFQWMSSATDESMWGWWDVAYYVSLFNLTRTDGIQETTPIAAYCADFTTGTAVLSLYKRLNLEDSTYFDSDVASHIRGVMNSGYWHDWTETDLSAAEQAANQWLIDYESGRISYEDTSDVLPGDAEDLVVRWEDDEDPATPAVPVDPIDGLTADQALVATQFAIWALANTNGYGDVSDGRHWIDFRAARVEGNPYDPDTEDFIPANIRAFYKYLLHQTAMPLDEDSILFSDDHFVSASLAMGSAGEENLYDIQVYFKLRGTVDREDDLEVTAAMGETSVAAALEDLDEENGYYILPLSGITEAEAAAGVQLALSGYQMVNDVYFYEAKAETQTDKREVSQNLVGWAEGLTPVTAALQEPIPVDLGNSRVRLYKVDGDNNRTPLPGAVFALYYTTRGGENLLVQENLVSDENGMVEAEGLIAGGEYFFVETQAPAGYLPDAEEYPVDWKQIDAETQIPVCTVVNCHDLGSLTVEKEVSGIATPQRFAFEISLDFREAPLGDLYSGHAMGAPTAVFDNVLFTGNEAGLFTARIALGHGESQTISGIPAGTRYTVTELGGENLSYQGGDASVPAGTIYQPARNDVTGVISGAASVKFQNATNTMTGGGGGGDSGPEAAHWRLTAEKTLDGAPADGYTFEMTDETGKTYTAISRNGVAAFQPIHYGKMGTYVYTLREKSNGDENVLWDDSVYTITVVVSKQGDYQVDEVRIEKNGEAAEKVLFENRTVEAETPPEQPEETPPAAPTPPTENPVNPPAAEVPATGDTLLLWLLAAGLSGGGLVWLSLFQGRKKRES